MAKFSGGETFTDTSPGKSVTHTRLNNHMANAEALPGLITEQTDVSTAIADDDTFLLGDTSAAGLKKVLAQNLIAPGAITAKTDISTAIAAADLLLMADASDSNALKKVQAQNILPPEAITAKTDLTATVAQDDIVLISDTSASGALKRTNVSGLFPSGAIIQSVADSDATLYTITAHNLSIAAGAVDNTTPVVTEGAEVLSVSITPSNASNILEVLAVIYYGHAFSGARVVGAMFQGSTCLAAAVQAHDTGDTNGKVLTLVSRAAAGSTSAQTISVRMDSTTSSLYVNGDSTGAVYLNGTQKSYLIVRELKA